MIQNRRQFKTFPCEKMRHSATQNTDLEPNCLYENDGPGSVYRTKTNTVPVRYDTDPQSWMKEIFLKYRYSLITVMSNLKPVLMSANFKRSVAFQELDLLPYLCSVADPDMRSDAFLTPGSGTQIQNPGWKKIRIRDEHPGSYFRELRNNLLG